MILECPSCQNRYLVDPRALGIRGRKVRCAKCKNEWFAAPPQEEMEDDVLSVEDVAIAEQKIPPIPEGSSVPAIPHPLAVPKNLKIATIALAVLFVLVSLVYFQPAIVRAIPALQGIYAALGMYPTDGIVLAGMEYEKQQPEGDKASLKDHHGFKGYIVNTSGEPRRSPHISIALQGKDNVLLRRKRLHIDKEMAPGEAVPFDEVLTSSPESLRHVVIEHGSPIELKLR